MTADGLLAAGFDVKYWKQSFVEKIIENTLRLKMLEN